MVSVRTSEQIVKESQEGTIEFQSNKDPELVKVNTWDGGKSIYNANINILENPEIFILDMEPPPTALEIQVG